MRPEGLPLSGACCLPPGPGRLTGTGRGLLRPAPAALRRCPVTRRFPSLPLPAQVCSQASEAMLREAAP